MFSHRSTVLFYYTDQMKGCQVYANCRLRNFTFGFNWIEFTHDALIKYQAMTCGFTLLHVPFFRKAYLPNRADPGLVLLGDLLGCALTPVKDTATCGAKHP